MNPAPKASDLKSAASSDGRIKLNFKNPVQIPSGSSLDVENEVAFVAENDNQDFFEYTSLTWVPPDGEYYIHYYYSVKYAGKFFSFTAKNNIGSITCDDRGTYTIDNLREANTDCSQHTVSPHLYDLPRLYVDTYSFGPNGCGMDLWINDNDDIDFRSNSFLSIQKPLGEKCN